MTGPWLPYTVDGMGPVKRIHSSLLRPLLAAGLLCVTANVRAGDEVIFIAGRGNTMPLASFEGEEITDGIVRDLGIAIARRLGRTARFVTIPRNRLVSTLMEGQADGVCYTTPAWLGNAQLRWSRPLIPNRDLVVGRMDAPTIASTAELADEPIGTVLGYRYPEFEGVLRNRFRRDNAPDMPANLRKLAAGRVRYAIVDQLTLQYEMRTTLNQFKPGSSLTIASFGAACAFSLKGGVPADELQRSADALLLDGTMDAILARYR